MATRINLMKLLQEMQGIAEMSRRNPTPKSSPLLLLQLQSHMVEISRQRRRLAIATDLKDSLEVPDPVPITFVRSKRKA